MSQDGGPPIRELVVVSVNGTTQDKQFLDDIAELEVEEHIESADVFRVRLSVRGDGIWRYLDDPQLAVWNRVAIRAGYANHHDNLIEGYITHVNVVLSGTGADESFLELSGMDASAVMDLEHRDLAWPDKRDSDIAQDIFASQGLGWEVEDTELVHGRPLATIMQSGSDIRFLQCLAERNGFECFVKDGKGYFRTANLEQPPQKPLQFGPAANLTTLRVEVDGTPPTRLEIRHIDPFEKREDRETLAELPERPLGKRTLAMLRAGVRDGNRVLRQQPSVSKQEMRARLRAGYQSASGFVTASGEVDGRSYGAVLRAKRLVVIKGAGTTHSGHYYVTRVRHLFRPDSYVQSFEARRNAVGLLGTESFAAPPALTPITPRTADAEPSTGNRLLPAQRAGQTGSPTPGGS